MDSAFSCTISDYYCPFSVSSPSPGHSLKRAHPPRLCHALPLLFYQNNAESQLCDVSCPAAPTPLVPYLGPFNGHFGMYECALEPAFIQKRNERERKRVRCVNQGYDKLRKHLPGTTADKRMSKVETLRAAIRYIKHLQQLLERREPFVEKVCAEKQDSPCNVSSVSPSAHHVTLHQPEKNQSEEKISHQDHCSPEPYTPYTIQ